MPYGIGSENERAMDVWNTELLKGFKYLYGQDLAVTKKVIRTCEETLTRRGFEEIMTPTVVDYSMIVGDGDRPIAPSDTDIVFDLLTVDGEKLALRYENTLPVALFYVENFSDAPHAGAKKFFYISSQFRNETEVTLPHRLRQFHQVGYELIGGSTEETLPDVIQVGSDLLSSLGLSHVVRVSDVRILSAVFKKLGLSPAERSTLRFLYNSGDSQEFGDFLARSTLDTRQKALLSGVFLSGDSTPKEMDELKALFTENGLEDMVTQLGCLDDVLCRLALPIRHRAAIDLSLVRTAKMYSGGIFQFYFEGHQHECGGGGEYNRVIQALGGPDVMACGAAFGVERIMHEYSKRRSLTS
jgi:histidyl-tRNA synthetase